MKKLLLFNNIDCDHCVYVTPIIKRVSQTLNIELEEYYENIEEYKIFATPTLILLKNNKEIARFVGYPPDQNEKEHEEFFKTTIEYEINKEEI